MADLCHPFRGVYCYTHDSHVLIGLLFAGELSFGYQSKVNDAEELEIFTRIVKSLSSTWLPQRLFPGMAKFANAPLRAKLKDRQGIINLVKQVAFDNFIHYTFIYFPVFYVLKEAIQVASIALSVLHQSLSMQTSTCPCHVYVHALCVCVCVCVFHCLQGTSHDGTPWGIMSGGLNKVNVSVN